MCLMRLGRIYNMDAQNIFIRIPHCGEPTIPSFLLSGESFFIYSGNGSSASLSRPQISFRNFRASNCQLKKNFKCFLNRAERRNY